MPEGRLVDERGVDHPHRVDGSLDFPLPEGDEPFELRHARHAVRLLPDEALHEMPIIRHAVNDFRRDEFVVPARECTGNPFEALDFHTAPPSYFLAIG